MALASAAYENAAIAAGDALITDVSLHTASTGTTGANEYSGVTRVAVTWGSASAGVQSNTGALAFTTSGATAVTHAGGWSAITAGTFELGFPLSSSVTAASISIPAGSLTATAS